MCGIVSVPVITNNNTLKIVFHNTEILRVKFENLDDLKDWRKQEKQNPKQLFVTLLMDVYLRGTFEFLKRKLNTVYTCKNGSYQLTAQYIRSM